MANWRYYYRDRAPGVFQESVNGLRSPDATQARMLTEQSAKGQLSGVQ
jgi:hypothetical protein